MKTTKLLIGAISVAAAFAAAKVSAQNISVTLEVIAPGLTMPATFNNGASINNIPAGVMKYTYGSNQFEAFCVEPLQDIGFPETLVYQVQDLSSLVNSTQIARLVGQYLVSARDDQNAAATQWAIWEIVAETISSPSLLDGNVRLTSTANQSTADLANQYLANINNFSPVSLTYLRNDERQDVVVYGAIPEPGALVLSALSGLLLLRRRR